MSDIFPFSLLSPVLLSRANLSDWLLMAGLFLSFGTALSYESPSWGSQRILAVRDIWYIFVAYALIMWQVLYKCFCCCAQPFRSYFVFFSHEYSILSPVSGFVRLILILSSPIVLPSFSSAAFSASANLSPTNSFTALPVIFSRSSLRP